MADSRWLVADSKFRFEKLEVWQIAVDLIKMIYQLSKAFPKTELYGITSQLQRAVVSIASNIAEVSGGRSSADFRRFLDISIGSALETASLILVAERLGYVNPESTLEIKSQLLLLIKKIYAFKKTV